MLPDDALQALNLAPLDKPDSRQEIVFIGAPVDAASIRAALDSCLVTEEEWAFASELGDPFQPWPSATDFIWEDEETPEVAF